MSTELPERPNVSDTVAKIAIIRSKYNDEFTQSLVDNCIAELNLILPRGSISITESPGGFEVPVVTEHVISKEKPDAVIAFGVIIRGATIKACDSRSFAGQ